LWRLPDGVLDLRALRFADSVIAAPFAAPRPVSHNTAVPIAGTNAVWKGSWTIATGNAGIAAGVRKRA